MKTLRAALFLLCCLHSGLPHAAPGTVVFFNNDELSGGSMQCDAVFPVVRTQADPVATATTVLEALFQGPTPEEKARGYRSFFSARTGNLLRRAWIEEDTLYIDLRDQRGELSGATSSCGSAEFFSQIQRSLDSAIDFERILFAIEGNPEAFYEWMEIGCDSSNDNCNPAPFAEP